MLFIVSCGGIYWFDHRKLAEKPVSILSKDRSFLVHDEFVIRTTLVDECTTLAISGIVVEVLSTFVDKIL
jgi:hypothetical protein